MKRTLAVVLFIVTFLLLAAACVAAEPRIGFPTQRLKRATEPLCAAIIPYQLPSKTILRALDSPGQPFRNSLGTSPLPVRPRRDARLRSHPADLQRNQVARK